LDGHVILNSGEVRANWLDLIKRANKHNVFISRIPSVEKALSRALKDISVVHRYVGDMPKLSNIVKSLPLLTLIIHIMKQKIRAHADGRFLRV
jgi:hypothetical protein